MHTVVKTPEFQWIDLVDPSPDSLNEIASQFDLPSTWLKDSLDARHLPKLERTGEVNFIILRTYDTNANDDADTMQDLTRKIALFVHDNFIISIHRKDQMSIAELREKWSAIKKISALEIRARILCDIINSVLHSYQDPLDLAVERVEELEDQIFRKNLFSSTKNFLEEGYYLRRKASVFKRMLRMLRDIIAKIDDSHKKTSPLYQDSKETSDGLYFYADELDENINQLLNLHLAMESARTNEASHRTNEVMRVLTIFSVFIMPLNLIVGIYGMNFENMPELRYTYGYPMILIFMVVVSFLTYSWFRRKGWLQSKDFDSDRL